MIINGYGDKSTSFAVGKGFDIASQRADELDELALEYVRQVSRTRPVLACDMACGLGGQAVRLAKAGADVMACDIIRSSDIAHYLREHGVEKRVTAYRFDMVRDELSDMRALGYGLDVICCQRAIHYFEFSVAAQILRRLKRAMRSNGVLFISASGLDSELAVGYAGTEVAASQRFDFLSKDMQQKHDIQERVCLYSISEFTLLAELAGFSVESIWRSDFGNIKAVLKKNGRY